MGSIKTILSIVVIGLVFFYLVNAYDLTYTGGVIASKSVTTRSLLQDSESVKDEVNTNIAHVPNFLKTMFKDAKVNLEVELNDGSVEKRQVVTRAGKIVSVQEGAFAKPEYTVWSTEKALDKVLSAEKPTEAFAMAVEGDEVTIKAHGTVGTAKVWIGRMMVKLYTLF